MRKINRWVLAGLCGAGLTVMSLSVRAEEKEKDENEVKMKIDDVPAAVKTTIVKETDDGKTVYEADAKINGTNYEIKVAEDGTLISKKIDKEEDDEKKDGEKMKDKD
jgi:hypothetical protein